jgi:lipoate-protein ligase A
MTRRTSPRTIAALVAGLAAGGAVGFAVGVPSLINAAPAASEQATDAGDDVTVAPLHHGEPHRDHAGPRGGGRALEVLTEVLGLDAETLRSEFAAGKSVADVATEQGVAPEAVADAIVDDLATHLAEHVADGTLTREEADAKLAEAETRVTERLDDVPAFGGERGGDGRGGRGPGRGPSEAVLTLLGIDAEALRAEFEAGRTIADVAADNGVDVQAVIDLMVTEAEAHIAEHVTEGKLTQEEADARLAELEARITERVNSVPTPGEGHGGRDGGRHGGRHGGAGHHGVEVTDGATGA